MFAVKIHSGETVHIKSTKQKVEIAPELRSRLDDLLGSPSHKLLMTKPKMKSGAIKIGSVDNNRTKHIESGQ